MHAAKLQKKQIKKQRNATQTNFVEFWSIPTSLDALVAIRVCLAFYLDLPLHEDKGRPPGSLAL